MLKSGLKNYFKSLKYFFTPLGTMFLGMIIGFSILIPGVLAAVQSLVDGICKLSESVNLEFSDLVNTLWNLVTVLNWDKPAEAIETMLSAEWLNQAVTNALSSILGSDFETFTQSIVALITTFTAEIKANVIAFFVCWLLGFVAGFALVKFFIRRNVAKRSVWKAILAKIINYALTALATVLCTWLFIIWQQSIYISVVCVFIVVVLYALIEAYLLFGYKKVPFKSVVNAKNMALYLLTDIIIFLITACITVIACVINIFMGLFVGLSLLVIAIVVISLNAESYVKGLTEATADAAVIDDANNAVAIDESATTVIDEDNDEANINELDAIAINEPDAAVIDRPNDETTIDESDTSNEPSTDGSDSSSDAAN